MAAVPYNPNAFSPAGGTGVYAPPPSYNANPSPQGGSGIFGAVPGAVGLPQPFKQLSGVYPGLGQTNTALSSDILSNLTGEVSPNTIAALHDAGAQFGVNEPMNISPLSLGETDQSLENTGLKQFGSVLPILSNNETLAPQVQAQIGEYNAEQAAAPNPSAAGAASTAMGILGLVEALA